MKNILLLTDFSDLSDYAKRLANKVALAVNAQLLVMTVVETSSEVLLDDQGAIQSSMGVDTESLHQEYKNTVEKINSWSSDITANYKQVVVFGTLLSAIKKQIKALDADLVIMGTHGVEGLRERISGSVTQHVILENRVPVLSLKCDRGDIDFSDFLITGDFSSSHKMDFDFIKSLQAAFKSKLHLLFVNTKANFRPTASAIKLMQNFAATNELSNVEYHIHNDETVEKGILNFSNNYDANHALDIDLVAVEKKNKSTLEYWFSGCEAIGFVNHIYRPIVTYLTK